MSSGDLKRTASSSSCERRYSAAASRYRPSPHSVPASDQCPPASDLASRASPGSRAASGASSAVSSRSARSEAASSPAWYAAKPTANSDWAISRVAAPASAAVRRAALLRARARRGRAPRPCGRPAPRRRRARAACRSSARRASRSGARRLQQGQRLAVAGEGAGRVAQVAREHAALHVGHPLVRAGQLELQRRVVAGLAREPVEVLEAPLHQQLPHTDRSGQRRHRVVHLEQERVGQLADVAEAPLGTPALHLGAPGLPGGGGDAAHERHGREHHARDRAGVAAHELHRPIGERRPPREHGLAFEEAPQVVGERLCRAVAPRRLLAQRLQHDGVEVALQQALQGAGGQAAHAADLLGVDGHGAPAVGALLAARDGVARHLGVLVADGRQHRRGALALDAIRAVAGQAARTAGRPASRRRWRR